MCDQNLGVQWLLLLLWLLCKPFGDYKYHLIESSLTCLFSERERNWPTHIYNQEGLRGNLKYTFVTHTNI